MSRRVEPGQMRVVIAGSRSVDPTDDDIMRGVDALVIEEFGQEEADDAPLRLSMICEVICGDAIGADSAGARWARQRGIAVHHDPVTDADYKAHGKYIGPRMRNRRMADRGTHAVIFWDGISSGSADMAARMLARGKPVLVVPMKRRASTRARAAAGASSTPKEPTT